MRPRIDLDAVRRVAAAHVAAFPGDAGIALHDPDTDAFADVHGNRTFPSASTIKVHLLAALLRLGERGEIDLDEHVSVGRLVGGSGVLAHLDPGLVLCWRDLATLMVLVSDNTATNRVLERIGLSEMRGFLDDLGLTATRIERLMLDAEAVAAGRDNRATPLDLARMWRHLLVPGPVSPAVRSACLATLELPKPSALAAAATAAASGSAPVASKAGWLDGVRAEAGVVTLAGRTLVIAVMTSRGPAAHHHDAWMATTCRDLVGAWING